MQDVDLDGLTDPGFPRRVPLDELGDFEVGLIKAVLPIRLFADGFGREFTKGTTSDFARKWRSAFSGSLPTTRPGSTRASPSANTYRREPPLFKADERIDASRGGVVA
jgi:hypothetical protein